MTKISHLATDSTESL